MEKPETITFYRRHLPHWQVHDRPYFVTFCQKGAFLAHPKIAKIVFNALFRLEKNHRWRIPYAVVMPNHVHCLMIGDKAVNTLNQSFKVLKGFTAREANKVLKRKGSFWNSESFDHWCRTPEQVERVIKYIKNNPVKAGLVKNAEDFPWLKTPNN